MIVYNLVLLLISCASLHAAKTQMYYNGLDSPEDNYSLEDDHSYDHSYDHFSQEDDLVAECLSEFLCPSLGGSDFQGIGHRRVKRARDSFASHNTVKDQGDFGRCWAFSVMASIERQIKKTYGVKVTLSEQYLVDCCRECQGMSVVLRRTWRSCFLRKKETVEYNGGYRNKAFIFLKNSRLVGRDSYSPYAGKVSDCQAAAPRLPYQVTDTKKILVSDETALIAELDKGSYISIGILVKDDFGPFFEANPTGIYPRTLCGSEGKTNHAVALVGYGVLPSGKRYWEIRNSWGEAHAHGGYFRMLRTGLNYCGFRVGQVPIVSKAH